MSNFKPKNILTRVFGGTSRKRENTMDYLYADFERYIVESPSFAYPGRATDDDDDGRDSITSFSTTATADDLPGTGRTLDTYIFQPMGRRIERLAMRFTIVFLHPARIAQYIEAGYTDFGPRFNAGWTLNDAIADVCSLSQNGSTVVAGMKGLVQQTQSNSINKSASALAALIRVSLSFTRKEIYVNVSHIEPIYHLETLARSLPCSRPEKKWFLLLVKLARETVIAVRIPSVEESFDPVLGKVALQLWPTPETALNLRLRLIRALGEYRSSGHESLELAICEACAICAEAVSTCIDYYSRGDAYIHVLETVYFTVIFILRSIDDLADLARITGNKHIYLVLRTLASWIDAILFRCLYALDDRRQRLVMNNPKAKVAFRSLVLVYGDTARVLLPQSLSFLNHKVLSMDVLPKSHRDVTKWGYINPIAQGLAKSAGQRTQRLLKSLDGLEREVWGCASQINILASQPKMYADPVWIFLDDFGDKWWGYWKSTLDRALKVQVPENRLTEEFREARRIGLEDRELWSNSYNERNWAYYELRRGSRRIWGQYLRSNMDWDWDLGRCMRRLFKVERQTRVGPSTDTYIPAFSSPAINVDAEGGETWNLKAPVTLPNEVRIAYETKGGEMQYVSFVPASSIPERRKELVPNGEVSVDATGSQMIEHEEMGFLGKPFSGEQEIKDIGVFSAKEAPCIETSLGGAKGSQKGRNTLIGFEINEVREGELGDAMSICSLD